MQNTLSLNSHARLLSAHILVSSRSRSSQEPILELLNKAETLTKCFFIGLINVFDKSNTLRTEKYFVEALQPFASVVAKFCIRVVPGFSKYILSKLAGHSRKLARQIYRPGPSTSNAGTYKFY